jgi:hypothetical protein
MNLKERLREKVLEIYRNGEDFCDLPYAILGEDNVKEWPVSEGEDEEEDEGEPQDMENFEWNEINDDSIVVCFGGDWQEPVSATIILDKNNELVVVDTIRDFFEEGIHEDEFNIILFGTNDYDKILKM